MIIDIAKGLLNPQQIWNLTRGLGSSDFIRADYAGIWALLTKELGLPELAKCHFWCTLPNIFYQQILQEPRRHNVDPGFELSLIDDIPTICISDIGRSECNLATFQNWSWLQRYAKAVVSYIASLPENATFQLLREPRYRTGEDARIAEKYMKVRENLYCDLPSLASLNFRTPPDMIGELCLQFDKVSVEFNFRDTIEIIFVDESRGCSAWDLAKTMAHQFPLVRINYKIGSYNVTLNRGWQEWKKIGDPPIFLSLDQKTDDPFLWAVELYVEASKKLASGDIEESQARVQELKDRVAVFNRSHAEGAFQFPFVEILEGKLAVQHEHGHCKFCGSKTDNTSMMMPEGFFNVYSFFTFCDDQRCKDAFKQYCDNLRESFRKHGPVSLFAAFNKSFKRAFSLRQRLFGPIKDCAKVLWQKTWQKRKSRKSAEAVVARTGYVLEPFAFEPIEYVYEEPVLAESEDEKDHKKVPLRRENIRLAMFGSLIRFILILLCLAGAQTILWMEYGTYLLVLPAIFFVVINLYVARQTHYPQILLMCLSRTKTKRTLPSLLIIVSLAFLFSVIASRMSNLNWLCSYLLFIAVHDIVSNQIYFMRARKMLGVQEKEKSIEPEL